MKIYLVGGAVRDELLGKNVTEKDWVVVGSTPAAMLDQGFRQVGRDFPVFIHPQSGEEYALARTERKIGSGYHGFQCFAEPSVTLEEDLKRRDLTINAIAKDQNGKIIDPYNGVEDLNNRILRHVSENFVEDPLRVLRIARFKAKLHSHQFTVASDTRKLLLAMVRQGELADLTPSRVWMELFKVLQLDRPDAFFEVLRECGALEVLFIELDRLYGVPSPVQWHPEIDTGVHTMWALRKSAMYTNDPLVRFAVLCHDFGKGITEPKKWPSHHGHDEKGLAPIKEFCQRLNVPNAYAELALTVSKWHIKSHIVNELTATQKLEFLLGIDSIRRKDRLEQVLTACKADATGRGTFFEEKHEYQQQKIWEGCSQSLNTVDSKKIAAEGVVGKEFGTRLQQERIKAIQQWMDSQ